MDDITVFTVPSNKPWIVTKEEAEEMFKNARKTPFTKKERAEIRKKSINYSRNRRNHKMNHEPDFYIDIEYDKDINDFDCGFEVFNAYLKYKF